MAETRLPMANDDTTNNLLGAILKSSNKTAIYAKNTDKNTFYGNKEDGKIQEKQTKELVKTTGGKDSNKTIDEVVVATQDNSATAKKNLIQDELYAQVDRDAAAAEAEELAQRIADGQSKAGIYLSEKFGEITQSLQTNLISGFTHGQSDGFGQIQKGLGELGNGIGVLGPIMNELKTVMHKIRAGFDLLFGSIRLLGAKVIMPAISFIKDKFKSDDERELEQLELDRAELLEELKRKQEIAKLEEDGQDTNLLDPLPLPVKLEGKGNLSPAGGEEEKGGLVDRFGRSLKSEPTDDKPFEPFNPAKSDKDSAVEKMAKLNKKKKDLTAKIDLDRKKKGEKKLLGFKMKKYTSFFKNLRLMSIARMFMPIILIIGLLYLAFKRFKEKADGATATMAVFASKGLTGMMTQFDKFKGFLQNKFPRIFGAPSVIDGKTVVPKGKTIDIDGKTYKGGQTLPKGSVINAQGQLVQGAKAVPGSMLRNATKQVARKLPGVGGVVETGLDLKENKDKFQAIKELYDSGVAFVPDKQGGQRQMTKEEFEYLEKAQTGNITGSVFKGGGAVGGALAGAALFSWTGPGAIVAGLIGGIIGGVAGSKVGDSVGTNLAELFTGVEDSQGVLDNLYAEASSVGNQLKEEFDEATDNAQNNVTKVESNNQVIGGSNYQENIYSETIPVSDKHSDFSYGTDW